MNKVLILTGPAGAGKNTVAYALTKLREKCTVIDIDLVRWMILQPHKSPWDGEEGKKQARLGIKNGCILARSFIEEGYDVIILDVLTDEIAQIYKDRLKGLNPKIVLLLPTYEEIVRRSKLRPPRLSEGRIKNLYELEKNLTILDKKIDNTSISAEEVAENLNKY